MKRSTAVAVLASALSAPGIARAQGLTSLKVAGVAEESVLPVLWGQKSGMFRAAGLDVDLTPQTSGSAITAGVVGGSYQVGKSSIIPLVTAYAKNIPIYSGWFAANAYIESDRAAMATFSRTERQAAAYVNSHPAETVAPLAAFTNSPADEIAKETRAMMATTLDPKLIQPVIDVCVRYKTIPSTFDATVMLATGLS